MTRNGIRISDLLGDFDKFSEKFRSLADCHAVRFKSLKVDKEAELERYKAFAERLRPLVTETVSFLHSKLDEGKNVLVEGANAAMLDIDFGKFGKKREIYFLPQCRNFLIFLSLRFCVKSIFGILEVQKSAILI